jgi:hypothetical protein
MGWLQPAARPGSAGTTLALVPLDVLTTTDRRDDQSPLTVVGVFVPEVPDNIAELDGND